MLNTAYETIQDADVILFLIDATKPYIGKAESEILEKIKQKKSKVILLINKIDFVRIDENLQY